MLKLLQGAGEKFIEMARKSASFDNHNGSLRSSIGYVIAKDGEVLTESFQESDKGADRIIGKYKGHKLTKEVSLLHTGGYVLVGVAEMKYTAAVEAKGYKVVSRADTQYGRYLRDTLKLFFSNM